MSGRESGPAGGPEGPPRGRLQPWPRVELPEYPADAAWSSDGRALVVGLADGTLLWFEVGRDVLSAPRGLPGHAGAVLALAWQKAGASWASCGEDGAVLLWDARTLVPRRIHQAAQWSERLAFAEDGRTLAVATGRTLSLFDTEGRLLHRHEPHPGAIAALAWRPKSGEIAAAGNGGVQLHRPPARERAPAHAQAQAQAQPQAPAQSRTYAIRGACLTAAFRPDGRVLAAGLQEGCVQLWDLAAGTQSQLSGYGARVLATEWSGSGRHLATVAGATLVVWDFSGRGPQGSEPATYAAHSERIVAMAFRPVGTWLVSAGRDRRLLLWRVGAGGAAARGVGPAGAPGPAAGAGSPSDSAAMPHDAHLLADECSLLRFSRDGARLAVGDARGGLTIFDCAL